MKRTLFLGFLLAASWFFVETTQARELGIAGKAAPSWGVSKWLNLPKGKKSFDVGDLKGKTVYLYGFQSWCPGCHRHGFPSLKAVMKHYQGDEDVAFVALQTTFEGFKHNGFEQAKEVAERYNLDIPVGQSGENGQRSEFMARYQSGGTPWTVIIGPDGVVRYNDFHISSESAIELIDQLKQG